MSSEEQPGLALKRTKKSKNKSKTQTSLEFTTQDDAKLAFDVFLVAMMHALCEAKMRSASSQRSGG